MAGSLDLKGLKAASKNGEIDTVVACFTDMQGRLMGKRFHVEFFIDSAWEETHSCNYLLATDMEMTPVPGYKATSWASGYGDYVMKPDMNTLRRIPWLAGTAMVLCDVLDHHHEEVPHSPRAVLKKQLRRLEALKMKAMMATELEFHAFRNSFADAYATGYSAMQPISDYNEDYHILQTTKEELLMRPLRNGLQGAGIPVECSKGEASPGQEEINIRYADALTMADSHSIIKTATKEIAWQNGLSVTFMARWSNDAAGSSSHIHQSLWSDDGKPLFYDSKDEHGMSPLMKQYLAGLLRHASELTYFLAPCVNSYKRFAPGLFAPTKAIWSIDNRTAGYRLCGVNSKAVRVECRVGGADLNPYLALAAQLAAGMAGIENNYELEPAFAGDAYNQQSIREIPANLRAATEALRASKMLRSAFGDDVVEHYTHAAQWEQAECDKQVTDWDRRRGFERG